MLTLFLLTVRLIQMKQQFLLIKLRHLNYRLFKKKSNQQKNFEKNKIEHFHNKFRRLSVELQTIFDEITVYDAFWRRFLTVYIAVAAVDGCYLLYSLIFYVHLMDLYQQYFVISFSMGIWLILFVLVEQCLKVRQLNKEVHRQQRQFYFFSQRDFKYSACCMIKVKLKV